jgi:hypothetical protein
VPVLFERGRVPHGNLGGGFHRGPIERFAGQRLLRR